MAPPKKSIQTLREERDAILKLKHKYEHRITVARYGKESLAAGDYGNAIKKFVDYLAIMAEIKEVKEIYDLKSSMFDPKKDLTEMLMISHIYFEMARIYDASPKYAGDSLKCLSQFVHFTANQPYQVVNTEMVRKSIKKSAFKNPLNFQNAYQKIQLESKKCYIVTFCYGDQHIITHDYRLFKDWLLNYSWGQNLVCQYYRFSSRSVVRYEKNFTFRLAAHFIVKPLLLLFSKTILPVIIKKC